MQDSGHSGKSANLLQQLVTFAATDILPDVVADICYFWPQLYWLIVKTAKEASHSCWESCSPGRGTSFSLSGIHFLPKDLVRFKFKLKKRDFNQRTGLCAPVSYPVASQPPCLFCRWSLKKALITRRAQVRVLVLPGLQSHSLSPSVCYRPVCVRVIPNFWGVMTKRKQG